MAKANQPNHLTGKKLGMVTEEARRRASARLSCFLQNCKVIRMHLAVRQTRARVLVLPFPGRVTFEKLPNESES